MVAQSQLFNPLPAVVIGGPPHSGKSVLAYSLTLALRERGVPHYLLRGYPPDGEGDWAFVPEQSRVRPWRRKGAINEAWLVRLRRDLANRQFPFLVDMGGLPTPDQEALLENCTHSILLTPDEASAALWRERFARHGLVPLAELRSDLKAQEILWDEGPLLSGIIGGLERGRQAQGVVTQRLITRLEALFTMDAEHLRRDHLQKAPVDLVLDLDDWARHWGFAPQAWDPACLPALLNEVPSRKALALYGRAPNWLYAALAYHALPDACYTFNASLGWVEIPTLHRGSLQARHPWQCIPLPAPSGMAVWFFKIPESYLDFEAVLRNHVPLPSPAEGLVLSGKLPLWLWGALARTCQANWIAIHQPQLNAAIVIASTDHAHQPGERIAETWPAPG